MIALICLFVPPLILACLRERIAERKHTPAENVIFYGFSVLVLNLLMLIVLYFGFDSKKEVCYKLNTYNDFAMKYMFLSVAIAIAVPYVEKYIKGNVAVKFRGVLCWLGKIRFNWYLAACAYAAVLFLLNFVRIFNDNFWLDEAFTIRLVRMALPDVIRGTAGDVHPPLYYLIVKAAYEIFGGYGWLFRFVSLIPCALILILAVTVFWDRFGGEMAVLLITMACLSGNAVIYNVEVRMYSWASFFVLTAFYELYKILMRGKAKDYILFAAFSLAASYTHYYSLVSAGFFYVALLGLAMARKADWKKVCLTCIGTVAGYLPWFWILVKTLLVRSEDYWITDIPAFKRSINYLFSNQFRLVVWGFLAAGMAFVFLYETGVVSVQGKEGGKIRIFVSLEDMAFSPLLAWLAVGICSILGTICVGIGISIAVRPFYLLRYIYPVSAVAWMILGVVVSRLKGKKIYTLLLLAYMVIVFFPSYQAKFMDDKGKDGRMKETLVLTQDEIQEGDVILSSNLWRMIYVYGLYYPDANLQHFDAQAVPELEEGVRYWLFEEKDEADAGLWPEEQGFSCEKIVDKGNIGTTDVYIYRIEK